MRPEATAPSLGEMSRLFLKAGATSFGGHLSLTGAVQSEAIDKRHWISGERWAEILAVCATLPGPLAVDAVACLGYAVRGLAGAVVAVVAVMLPALLLITLLAVAYGGMNQYASLNAAFKYFMPAVAGIVLFASLSLGRQTLRQRVDWLIAGCAAAWLGLSHGHQLGLMLAIAALAGYLMRRNAPRSEERWPHHATLAFGIAVTIAGISLALPLAPIHSAIWELFAGFSATSVLMIGGGYAAVPLFEHVTVTQHAWVTLHELTDALALSQLTPGPILVSAAFIGYRAAGYWGEAAAMAGMFLPMIAITILVSQTLNRINRIWWVNGMLAGVKPAIVGMIAMAALQMVPHFPDTFVSGSVLLASLAALVWLKQPTWTVIALSAVVGMIAS